MIPINARLVKLVGPVLDLHRDYQSDGKTIERLYREDGWTCGAGDTIYARDKYPHKVYLIYPQGNNGRIAEYDLFDNKQSHQYCIPYGQIAGHWPVPARSLAIGQCRPDRWTLARCQPDSRPLTRCQPDRRPLSSASDLAGQIYCNSPAGQRTSL